MDTELDDLDTPTGATPETASDDGHGQLADSDAKAQQQEAFIAKLKGKFGSLNAEYQKQAERLAALEARLEEQRFHAERSEQREQVAPVDPYALDESALEEFRSDPVKLLEFQKGREQDMLLKIQRVFEAQRELHKREIDELRTAVKTNDPTRSQYRGAIDALIAKNAKLKALDEDTLIEIVKATGGGDAGATEGGAQGWRGAPGSGKPASMKGGRYTKEMEESDMAFFMALESGNVERAKNLVNRKRKKFEEG